MKREESFLRLMNNIDDSYLEEAVAYSADTSSVGNTFRTFRFARYLASAACVVVIIAGFCGYTLLREDTADKQVARLENDTVRTLADLDAMGYQASTSLEGLVEKSETVDISLLTMGSENELQVAQVYFEAENASYTYRECLSPETVDISDCRQAAPDTQDLTWTAAGNPMTMESAEDGTIWVSWYDESTDTQHSLGGANDSSDVIQTAYAILTNLGYPMDVAPTAAANVTYDVYDVGGLTVAETSFTLDGISYTYRTAGTSEVTYPFADISGETKAYTTRVETELGWCQAVIYAAADGSGKIIWFDIAPGLLYSLTMNQDASAENLLAMAETLYEPTQGNAG